MDEELAAIAAVFRTCATVLRRRAETKGLDGAASLLLVAAHESEGAAASIDQALAKKRSETSRHLG